MRFFIILLLITQGALATQARTDLDQELTNNMDVKPEDTFKEDEKEPYTVTGNSQGGGVVQLQQGQRCDQYLNSQKKLEGASCPQYTGCFPSDFPEFLSFASEDQEEKMEPIIEFFENYSDLEVGESCEGSFLKDRKLEQLGRELGKNYSEMAQSEQIVFEKFFNPAGNGTISKNKAKKRGKHFLCKSLNCKEKKCAPTYACGCAGKNIQAPTARFCCEGLFWDKSSKTCKSYDNFFEVGKIDPPPMPTVENSCSIDFPADNPARELFIMANLFLRSWDILSQFKSSGSWDEMKLWPFESWKKLSEQNTETRMKMLNAHKQLTELLDQSREKVLNDKSYKNNSLVASGAILFELMKYEQDIVLNYERALLASYKDWYRVGLPTGEQGSESAEVMTLMTPLLTDKVDHPYTKMSGVCAGKTNFLCLRAYWSAMDENTRACEKKSLFGRKKAKNCYQRKYKVKKNAHFRPNLEDYLQVSPLNEIETNQEKYNLYDIYLPNNKKFTDFGNGTFQLGYALGGIGALFPNNAFLGFGKTRTKKFNDINDSQEFYYHTYQNVFDILSSDKFNSDSEYIDYELGLKKSCLKYAKPNKSSLQGRKGYVLVKDPTTPKECDNTVERISQMVKVVYAMNWAFAYGEKKSSQKEVFGMESMRMKLLKLLDSSFRMASGFLEMMTITREQKKLCLAQMKLQREELFAGGLNLTPGTYEDGDDTGSQQGSVQGNSNSQGSSGSTTGTSTLTSPVAQYGALNGVEDQSLYDDGNLLSKSLGLSGDGQNHAAIGKNVADNFAADNLDLHNQLLASGDSTPSLSQSVERNLSSLKNDFGTGSSSSASTTSSEAPTLSQDEVQKDTLTPNAQGFSNQVAAQNPSTTASPSSTSGDDLWGDFDSAPSQNDFTSSGSVLKENEKESILANLKESDYKEEEDDSLFTKVTKRYFLYGYPKLLSKKKIESETPDTKEQKKLKNNLMDSLKDF